jgi:hypothetical protein
MMGGLEYGNLGEREQEGRPEEERERANDSIKAGWMCGDAL